MIMRGASLKDLQELLGNKSTTMVLRYAHLTQEHKKNVVNLLKGLTASSGESSPVTKVSQQRKSRSMAAVKQLMLLVAPGVKGNVTEGIH